MSEDYHVAAPKSGLQTFAIVHGLIIVFCILTIIRPWGGTETTTPVPIEVVLLIGAILSFLQFSIGRIVIRLYCLWVFLHFASQLYYTHSTSFLQVVELVWWIFVYSCFGKASWWYALYHPLGMFGKRSNPAY
jgi:hypothetical protein